MNRATLSAAALIAALLPATAFAALRVPQAPVTGTTLQDFFTGATAHDPGVTVGTGQDDTQIWRSTISGNVGVTLQIELAGSPSDRDGNRLGIYNSFDGTKFQLFDGLASDGYYAVASFKAGNQLVVHRVKPDGTYDGNSIYAGVEPNGFGFYLDYETGLPFPNDVFSVFTQDSKNKSSKVGSLTFLGTGANAGCWWVCFEDGRNAGLANAEDNDYDDAVLFVESVNPSPVTKATWASVKARFR